MAAAGFPAETSKDAGHNEVGDALEGSGWGDRGNPLPPHPGVGLFFFFLFLVSEIVLRSHRKKSSQEWRSR